MALFLFILLLAAGPTSYFYGWDVIQYIVYIVDAYLRQFPWQVQVSFVILALSILMIIILFIMFSNRMMKRMSQQREFEQCQHLLHEAFTDILKESRKMTWEEMEYVCKADRSEIREFGRQALTRLVITTRMELSDHIYLPNMQHLCGMIGVTDALEQDLVKGRNVTQTLQILMTLPLRVSEGALAVYTGNKNERVRELARSYYGFCSKAEPFNFVMQDLNESFHLWYPTTFHRLCSWHRQQGHPTPQLLVLAENSTNDAKKALFISEIPYYGTEDEKRGIERFLSSQSNQCSLAAIKALALIADPESEQVLIKNYDKQFPDAKRETLRAIATINTGKQTEFFRYAYLHSTSHSTRAVALSCLFNYGEEGRRVFYELAEAGLDDNRFFQQIIHNVE